VVSTHQRVSLLLFTNLITIAELFSYASSSPRQANVEIAPICCCPMLRRSLPNASLRTRGACLSRDVTWLKDHSFYEDFP
jgi:hypothetical protein